MILTQNQIYVLSGLMDGALSLVLGIVVEKGGGLGVI